MKTRFKNLGWEVGHFHKEKLIECPRCGKCATFTTGYEPGVTKYKIVCHGCGHSRQAQYQGCQYPDAVARRFHRPLWLQTSCCGETLWAFNLAHLNWLERYVSAELREEGYHRWITLTNRLPRWMKLAKHRDEVLKGIARLKKRACEG